MSQRFLAVGECMLELSPAGEGMLATGFAGDTFNTAWYMRRLAGPEVEVAYYSAIGDDAPSRDMKAFMSAAGVIPELKERAGGHVGLYMISLDNGERSFSYWRDTSAAKTLADDLDTLPVGAGDTVLFSGITLAVLPDAGRERLLAAMNKATANGTRVVFDTNLRPRLWKNNDEMRHWIMRGAGAAELVLPSFEDEEEIFGDADIYATAARYHDAGCGTVIVKDGAGPVLISAPSGQSTIAPKAVSQVVDTTAAGDSFNAGFLSSLYAGETMETAVAKGCVISAKVIGARGALVDID